MLCLAGAGGLQAPLFACAGAEVTVLDISEKMLAKDRKIAKEEQLNITIEKVICVICHVFLMAASTIY